MALEDRRIDTLPKLTPGGADGFKAIKRADDFHPLVVAAAREFSSHGRALPFDAAGARNRLAICPHIFVSGRM